MKNPFLHRLQINIKNIKRLVDKNEKKRKKKILIKKHIKQIF